ncbi:MAG: HK97 gp10 family phage protein [Acidimicrobiales bacterium]
MAGGEAIRIVGLREFQRAIKAVDRDLPKALRMAFNDAAKVVVDDAQPRVPRRSGTAAATVRAKSTQRSTRVAGGGSHAPYYPWLDFGGRVGRRRSVERPFLDKGRYIYNAYYRKRDSGEFTEALERGLVKVAERAGVKVT